MNTNFTLGLQVTAIGMALVFLTLIIVMVAIILLDRVFRPKAAHEEEAAPERALTAVQAAPVVAPAAVPVVAQAAMDSHDEVAAIGFALAAALASRVPGARAGAALAIRSAANPAVVFPWDKPRATDAAPQGDIVTVVNIDGGSPVWRSEGRLKAVEKR